MMSRETCFPGPFMGDPDDEQSVELDVETFELILVLLACVILSAVLEQVVRRVSLPLVQIAVGFVAALIVPHVAHVEVDSELFLVLFIAPLLFNEARESGKRDLWDNKFSILSLAIGLVLLTVLIVGFALNWLVPSIPLAAAFACAGALGPTDAAAVGALGSTIKLSTRQKTLLSGESLINDASGVVSFQFAIAAAVTGAFSALEATSSFAILFFGGILAGVVMGLAAYLSVALLRRRGFENTTVHVLYEVFTPFVVFLLAEAMHVSGILAVVAAGIVMAQHAPRLSSATLARQQVVSNGFWEIIVFLINGIIFVLLGMQLPQALSPDVASGFSLPALIGIITVMSLLVIGARFLWVSVMELGHRNPETGERGIAHVGRTLRDSLVTTIAGPKGAVTLSIIFTIPYTVESGAPFPERSLIIFLTSGVILFTLVVADVFLPLIAPKNEAKIGEDELRDASIKVLAATLEELRAQLFAAERPEYEPAMRLTTARYRARLVRERMERDGCGDVMRELIGETLSVQQALADEIQQKGSDAYDPEMLAPYNVMLRGIRSSVGYFGIGVNVGSRSAGLRGRLAMLKQLLRPTVISDEHTERIYYDTCLFAIELENAAIEYLEGIANADDGQRGEVAEVLANEHRSVLDSLWGRIDYGQEQSHDRTMPIERGVHDTMPEGMEQTFGEQFAKAHRYADEVDAEGLAIELAQIVRLRDEGEISEAAAKQLRENVYLLQMSLEE